MQGWRPRIALLILLATAGVIPAPAHHAFAAEFDGSRHITLTGTVKKVAWLNPHARLYLDVKETHSIVPWEFVLGSPNFLIRQGWEKTVFKVGDVLTITGFLARDGSHMASARTIVWSDGRKADFGPEGDGGPPR